MTEREFMEKVIAIGDAELIEFAQKKLDKINERNAKRASTPTKSQIANMKIKEDIRKFFAENEGSYFATEISESIGVSRPMVSALMRQLIESGEFIAEDVKVKGKGKRKSYKIV